MEFEISIPSIDSPPLSISNVEATSSTDYLEECTPSNNLSLSFQPSISYNDNPFIISFQVDLEDLIQDQKIPLKNESKKLINILDETLNVDEKSLLIKIIEGFIKSDSLQIIRIEKVCEINRNSFNLLWNNEMINDEIINSSIYLSCISSNNSIKMISSLSLVCKELKDKKKNLEINHNTLKYIVSAINLNSSHWGLLFLKIENGKIYFGESKNNTLYAPTTQNLSNFVEIVHRNFPSIKIINSLNFERINIYFQTDNWSCGLHVMKIIESLSLGNSVLISSSNDSMIKFKSIYLKRLLNLIYINNNRIITHEQSNNYILY